MKSPHISVVIPAYNERYFLSHCLDALSRQTVMPDVVYVVDNNSTDGTADIARKYSFVQLLQEPIQGICAATKTGLDTASAHDGIILRCDADCRPEADWVERILGVFGHDPAVDAATGPGRAYDCPRLLRQIIDVAYMKPYFFFTGLALGRPPLFGSNFAIRSDAWRKISNSTHLRTHQNIHDDIDISYHLVAQGHIVYDGTIVMPISARPFKSFRGMINRFVVGFRSIFIHWPEQAPWQKHLVKQRRD